MSGSIATTLGPWVTALALAVGPSPDAAEPVVTLRFRPAPGTTLQLAQEITQKGTMQLGPSATQSFASEMRLEATQRVSAGETGSLRTVEQVIDRVAMSVRQGGAEVLTMDTASPQARGPEQELFARLLGRQFVVHFDELGAIRGAEGLDAIFAALAESADPQARELLSRFQQAFNDETMIQMMQAALPVFPARPVAVGDSWSHRTDLSNPLLGAIEVDSVYTFEGLERYAGEECARLAVALTMRCDFDPLIAQLRASAGGKANVEMDVDPVETAGSLCIARTDGVTLVSEMHPALTMRMRLSAEGREPLKMRMLVDQAVRQTVTRR